MKPNATKYQDAVETLKKEILEGKFAASRFSSVARIMGRFGVARATSVRILSELKKAGLVRSSPGRGTFVNRSAATRKLGLIMPGIAVSDFFQPILCELNRLARASGYELNFGEVYSQRHAERVRQVRELAAEFVRRRVAGVIYEPLVGEGAYALNAEILRVLDRKRIPVVLLDSDIVPFPGRSAYDVVGTNDVKAGAVIARHLVDVGAKRIHFHVCPEGPVTFDNRVFGARAWLASLGKSFRTAVLASRVDDVAALRRHLKVHGRPDAFVCRNDAAAAVFKKTLEEAGLAVPRDVMITGFADLAVASLTTPPLTTVRQDREAIAQAAFRQLLARMGNPDMPPCDCFLPAPLVVRASSARRTKNLNKPGRRNI